VDEKNILAQRNCWEEKYIELGYTEQTPHEGKKKVKGVDMDLGRLRLSKGETKHPQDIDHSRGRLNNPNLERPSKTWSSRPPLVY
jgi:hypothetical protein